MYVTNLPTNYAFYILFKIPNYIYQSPLESEFNLAFSNYSKIIQNIIAFSRYLAGTTAIACNVELNDRKGFAHFIYK